MKEDFDLRKFLSIVEAGLSAAGTPALGVDELRMLSLYCLGGDILLHTIEGFLRKEGDEVMDLGYSLFGPDEDIGAWVSRVSGAVQDAFRLAKKAEMEGVSAAFYVWMTREGE